MMWTLGLGGRRLIASLELGRGQIAERLGGKKYALQ
jgi:hypothetical protein